MNTYIPSSYLYIYLYLKYTVVTFEEHNIKETCYIFQNLVSLVYYFIMNHIIIFKLINSLFKVCAFQIFEKERKT